MKTESEYNALAFEQLADSVCADDIDVAKWLGREFDTEQLIRIALSLAARAFIRERVQLELDDALDEIAEEDPEPRDEAALRSALDQKMGRA